MISERADPDPQFKIIVAFGGTDEAEISMAIEDCSMRGVVGMLSVILTLVVPGGIS